MVYLISLLKKGILLITILVFLQTSLVLAQEGNAPGLITATPFVLTFSNQTLIKGIERGILLSWTKYQGAIEYNLLFKEEGSDWEKAPFGNDIFSTEWRFESNKDLQLQMEACLPNKSCIKSNIVFVPFDNSSIRSQNISFVITPNEPVTLEEEHIIKVQTKDNNQQACASCIVKFMFDSSQPGDEIVPLKTITNSLGEAEVKVKTFIPIDRMFLSELILPDGTKLGTNSITLHYEKTPVVLAYMKLISHIVFKRGFALPPMGNVYPKVLSETDLGNGQREVVLSWNSPFGAKLYRVNACIKDRGCSTSLTSESQSKIKLSKSIDYYLIVDACTKSTACVNSYSIMLGQVDTAESITYDISQANSSFDNSENAQKQESDSTNNVFAGPLGGFLKFIYSLF